MKRVAIIGGGLSGLSAAYQLSHYGIDFTLFEASGRLGGIVETVRRDGFIIECGPDSWVTEKPWARDLAVELGLESEIIGSNDLWRRTYILRDNRLVPMPDGMRMMVPTQWEPVLNSPLFSETARLAFQDEYRRAEELKSSSLPDGKDESVASFVRRHFGEEITRTIAGPLLAGVFGGSVEELSVRAVMPAFVKLERDHGSLIAALQNTLRGDSGPVFTSLKAGLATLIEGMAERLNPADIRLNHEVKALKQKSKRWQIIGSQVSDSFDEVIVATPSYVTRHLICHLHSEFDELLNMEATSTIVIAMAFSDAQVRQPAIPPGFGYLVPQTPSETATDLDPQLLACTFVNQKFPHRAPDGAVLLRGFFGGDTAPILLSRSDAELVDLAYNSLSRALGPLPRPDITLVRRWPLSLPQYAVGHIDRMARLSELTTHFPSLHLIGNAYYGVGLPDLIRQGRDTALRIAHS